MELVGGHHFSDSVAMVAPGGRISVIGLLDAKDLSTPTTPILLKAPIIQGIVTGHRRALEDFIRAIDRVGLKPVIDCRYPFQKLQNALDHLQTGAFGKIIIDVSN